MIKNLILTLSVLSLAACAFDKDKTGSNKQNRQLQEDNEQVDNSFSKVAGLYSGTLKRPNGDEKIEISLGVLGEPTGKTNDDGTAEIRYRQAAAYLRINPFGATLTNFAVNFIPETGSLTLVNQDKDLGVDEVHSIFAKIIKGRITGKIRSLTGDIGTLNLQLSANESANPANGAQEEYNQRLRQQFRELTGVYTGCVKPAEGSTNAAYTVSMTLSIVEDATADGKTTTPRLGGSFHRDYDKLGALDASLSATYRPDLLPATLNIVGKPFVSNNGYVSTFQGSIVDGNYEATFSSTRKGLEGMLYLKKGTTYPAKCAGQK